MTNQSKPEEKTEPAAAAVTTAVVPVKSAPKAATKAPVSAKTVKAPAKKAAAPAKRPAAKPAPVKAVAAKPVAAKPAKPAKPVAQVKPEKQKKPKLVRDSFTIPKDEYELLSSLKARSIELKQPAKKSELLRAGIKLLASLKNADFLKALSGVPALKTGRPAK
jgi:hypothetical protein